MSEPNHEIVSRVHGLSGQQRGNGTNWPPAPSPPATFETTNDAQAPPEITAGQTGTATHSVA